MYRDHRIAVVAPAYNVGDRIARVVATVPSCVDALYVVDDASTDGTAAAVASLRRRGLHLVQHATNCGVGAAIATGYARALEDGADIVVVMAGDGQMDPADLPSLLDPIVEGAADYVKGDRFTHPSIWSAMPRMRLVGNILLSLLTKVTSGYYGVFDSQCGYTAIARSAAAALNGRFYCRYGYPNDILARLRPMHARVAQVSVRPVYEGQRSGIRLWTVFYPVLFVVAGSYVRRLSKQYVSPLFRFVSRGARRRRRLRLPESTSRASSRPS